MPNIFQALAELPIRRAIQVVRNKIQDTAKDLDTVSFFDQYPGKAVPYVFSKTYQTGLVDPSSDTFDASAYLLPSTGNILTGRDAAFYWCETNAWVFGQRNVGTPNAGLFNSTQQGGGAAAMQNVQGPLAINNLGDAFSYVGFEIDLYDKKRDRSITNGRIPGQTFVAGSTGYRRWREAPRWDPDTEIEPRVFVTDASSPAALAAGNERFFINICFKGFLVLEEVTGRETLLAGEDDR